jgi:tripartite-type tricarboxylate transporter receptor subunit TctC
MKNRRLVLAALAALCLPGLAPAQTYPDKPVKVIIPWPAGGTGDVVTRVFLQKLSQQMNNPVVPENRAGATGMIGAGVAAQAPADGYTLLLAGAETHNINPFTYRKLSYDPAKDFVLIAPFVINPFTVVGRSDVPIKSIDELVERAKANPGKLAYSSAGLGSASQMAMEIFRSQAGLDLLHVPFQGEAPAVTALMGGQVDMMILPAGRAEALRKSGKVRVLAVTIANRFHSLQDVPTLKESGFDVNVANWFGLAAPAKTPAPVVQRLYADMQAVVKNPEAQAALRGMGVEVFAPISQPDFEQFVAAQGKLWGEVIRRSNIKLDQ